MSDANDPRPKGGGVMERDDAEEYTQALGQIVVGSWRQIALAQRLGVPNALGMSLETWVNERLGGYIRLFDPRPPRGCQRANRQRP